MLKVKLLKNTRLDTSTIRVETRIEFPHDVDRDKIGNAVEKEDYFSIPESQRGKIKEFRELPGRNTEVGWVINKTGIFLFLVKSFSGENIYNEFKKSVVFS